MLCSDPFNIYKNERQMLFDFHQSGCGIKNNVSNPGHLPEAVSCSRGKLLCERVRVSTRTQPPPTANQVIQRHESKLTFRSFRMRIRFRTRSHAHRPTAERTRAFTADLIATCSLTQWIGLVDERQRPYGKGTRVSSPAGTKNSWRKLIIGSFINS